MYDPHQKKEDACQYSEIAVPSEANKAEVSSDTSTADTIAEQKHEVAAPSVDFSNVVNFLLSDPIFVAFVKVHHTSDYHACKSNEKCYDQSYEAED